MSKPMKLPPRIAERPDVASWPDDAALSLTEAACLFFPTGKPLSVTALRRAMIAGKLAHVKIANKYITSPSAMKQMLRPKGLPPDGGQAAPAPPAVLPTEAPKRRGRRANRLGNLTAALARSPVQA